MDQREPIVGTDYREDSGLKQVILLLHAETSTRRNRLPRRQRIETQPFSLEKSMAVGTDYREDSGLKHLDGAGVPGDDLVGTDYREDSGLKPHVGSP